MVVGGISTQARPTRVACCLRSASVMFAAHVAESFFAAVHESLDLDCSGSLLAYAEIVAVLGACAGHLGCAI